jgi:hypothetical protein
MDYTNDRFSAFRCPSQPYQDKEGIRPLASDTGEILAAEGSGDAEVEFKTDENGDFYYEISKIGYGVNLKLEAWIICPDAIYDLEIESSGSGGGSWTGLRTIQHVNCVVSTSYWYSTTIKIYLHSTIPDSAGKAYIHYEY